MKSIINRIEEKKKDYLDYNFSQKENDALKTFFDLAQEFDDIEEFYGLCVAIPKGFFNLDACLYLVDPKENGLVLAAKTDDSTIKLNSPPPDDLKPDDNPYYTHRDSLVLTIRGNSPLR
jgi:hypothetical protein